MFVCVEVLMERVVEVEVDVVVALSRRGSTQLERAQPRREAGNTHLE